MIVADTNLILYLLLEIERTPAAETALERDESWCAPPLWVSKCCNALVLYIREGLLTLEVALSVVEAAQEVLGERVLDVATEAVMEQAIARGLPPTTPSSSPSRSGLAYGSSPTTAASSPRVRTWPFPSTIS